MNSNEKLAAEDCPRVVLSESVEQKQAIIREEVKRKYGNVESVLELGGLRRNRDIIITDCLIPEAELGLCTFDVSARALSRCWEQAGKAPSTKHLLPIGDLHYHPGTGSPHSGYRGPCASSVDEANSLRLANLYHEFNLQECHFEKTILQQSEILNEDSVEYVIDPFSSLYMSASQNDILINTPIIKRRRRNAFWASLIRFSDGNSQYTKSYVLEHVYSSESQKIPEVIKHVDVETLVMSNEEVSELSQWPMDLINLDIDRDKLALEVSQKYPTDSRQARHSKHRAYSSEPYSISWNCSEHEYCPYRLPQIYDFHQFSSAESRSHHALQDEFIYLREDASLTEIAALLRESAIMLEADPFSPSTVIHLRYLANSGHSQLLQAVKECVQLISRQVSFRDSH
jgi:hypothetical protein